MGFGIGPSPFWMRTKESADYFAVRCPVATTLGDGSRIFCKTGGRAWIVAPSCTQVGSQWAGGQYNSTCAVEKCCISEWPGLRTQLVTCGFNPCDWFVPNLSQLQSGYTCRCNWDTFSSSLYWTSTEFDCIRPYYLDMTTGLCSNVSGKSGVCCVRAFRCVTY